MSDKPETIPDIIAEMRIGVNALQKYGAKPRKRDEWMVFLAMFADRLEAAYKRDPGNMQKMREALENCANMGEQIDCQLGSSDETVYAFRHERCLAYNISECARAALAAPPRNCDVGTAEEQVARFIAFCKGQRLHSSGHADTCNPKCPCRDGGDINLCALTWAQMPYEEGGEK